MSLSSAPRALGKFQYRLLRAPSRFLEQRVLSRLPEDHPRRLMIERALGGVDVWAGHLFGDDGLATRGEALQERADTLRRARELEQSAQARQAAAESTLEQEKEAAGQDRQEAVQHQQQDITEARQTEQRSKSQARQQGKQTAASKQKQADDKADNRLQAVSSTRQQHETALNEREQRTAEQRQEQVSDAKKEAGAAQTQRAKADRLDGLAEQERSTRTQQRRKA